MSNISRRKFLKGAGGAVLAVAASGVLAGCGSGNKVTPTPTPTTKPVDVTYVLEDGTKVTTNTINVDFTKLKVTNHGFTGLTEEDLKPNVPKTYSIVDVNNCYITEKDGKYFLTVVVAKTTVTPGKEQVPVVFYVKNYMTGDVDVTDKVLKGRTVSVDADATTVDVSGVQLPDGCGYKIMDTTAEIKVDKDGKRVARVWVAHA